MLRAFLQFLYLTPKAPILPEPPTNKAVLGPLLGINLLCLLLHIWLSAPSAGEATQGYLHGGLAMDFIGQQGPTSKVHLVLLDLFILTLQLIMLPACLTRRKLRESAVSPDGRTNVATPAPSSANQDLDSEERGVRRSQEEDGIELQNLRPPERREAEAASTNEVAEREALLSPPQLRPANDTAIVDTFNSGQIILADLDVVETIRVQLWLTAHPPPPSAEPARTEQRTLRAELAGRMLRMRLGGAAF